MSESIDRTRRISVAIAAAIALFFAGAFLFQAATTSAIEDGESTYVPIDPCRLFDTRSTSRIGPQGPIGPASAAEFQVTGTNGECTIPLTATAISINVAAAVVTEQTNVRIYPADEPLTETAVLNPRPGDIPTSNKVDVELSPDGQIAIYNRFGGVDLVGDVLGYYRGDGLQDLETRVAALEGTRSFAQMATDDTATVGTTAQTIASLAMEAPADGNVTVNMTANIVDANAGQATRCSITTGSTLEAGVHRMIWESPGDDGDRSNISSTRMLAVSAGDVTINLVCDHEPGGTSEVTQTVMTAIFTPAAG